MSINKSYAVLGMGRYGKAVAKELIDSGAEVIVVDKDYKIIEDLTGEFPVCKCADITDEEVIEQLGISDIDTVIIAIAGELEASIMATLLCKEAGAGNVIVKCYDERHKEILEKIGADMVVLPEKESGVRLAQRLLSSGFTDIVDISDDISIIELEPKPEWIGKSLKELDLRKKHSVNVIALNNNGKPEIVLHPDTVISEETKVIVIANKKEIDKL